MAASKDSRRQETLRRYEKDYDDLKARLQDIGFVLQGSVIERRMECGKPQCRCHVEPNARHGPYYQWSWKKRGKTVAVFLTSDQVQLCKEWIGNNRELERITKRMRALSFRAARLQKIAPK
jgi:hypothetical protein